MITRRMLLAGAAAVPSILAAQIASAQGAKLPVVASFSILGDIVANVGGERIALKVLVPAGGDAHVYAPTPADARTMAEAQLVIANGLTFEGWLRRLAQSSGSKAPIIEASSGIKGRVEKDDHGHGAKDKHGHDHGGLDPHAWQSVANVKTYVGNIRDALAKADPAGKEAYAANARRYLGELDALEADIKAAVARIPQERRQVITSHDAFGYFSDAYGVAFIAPRGVSTEAEASAKDVARIITQVKRDKIAAVFLENVSDQRLMQQIARETGAKIGGTLYPDSLSPPDGPAPTYIRMMRHNIRTISEALTPAS
jgi:zinc/manganese transport system substrate-binding protein